MTELEVYAENTRSLVLYMNLHLLKIDDPNALTAASHIGRCLGICDVIKKLPYYLAVHRGYIPQDVLLRVSPSFSYFYL
jgi:phytoene/squalene synthetase